MKKTRFFASYMFLLAIANVALSESYETSVDVVEEILKDREITFIEELALAKPTETIKEQKARERYLLRKSVITNIDKANEIIRNICTQRIGVLTQKLMSFIEEQEEKDLATTSGGVDKDIYAYIEEFYRCYGLEESYTVQHLVSVCRDAIFLAEIKAIRFPSTPSNFISD